MNQYKTFTIVLLAIVSTCHALPRPQEDQVEVATTGEVTNNGAYYYEELRDHDLQASVNAGQSGSALKFISEGGKPQEVVWGVTKPKRQVLEQANTAAEVHAMTDELEVPEPAPISEEYAQRLSGSAIALANKLAGAHRQAISRVPGYGRKRRQVLEQANTAAEVHAMTDKLEVPEPAPISEEYAQRLSGSAIALANKLAGAHRQAISRVPGYGRKRRQVEITQDELIMEEIFDIEQNIREAQQLEIHPQITNWGETGLLKKKP
jgi:hypothetical protein